MQELKLLTTLTILLIISHQVTCLTHTRTLMWTVKSVLDGSVDVRGIPGDPDEWVVTGIREWSISYFSDTFSRAISRRVALAFQYSTRRIFFSDKGFKEIFRITLQVAPFSPFTYNVSLEVVYGGISTEVNGLAMDWASGSIYWTDALYNWITVANASDYGVSKHIIHTGFSRPMGLTVHPKKGLLFWSVVGAVPKIERSTLGGADRTNFIDTDIDRPLGLSIDYKADHLYWVDDLRDTIERVDLNNPTNRRTIHVGYRHSATAKLFSLAVYNDFIFATDQVHMGINIYNRTTGSFIRNFTAVIFDYMVKGIPYDIQMYDVSIQEEIDSDCNRIGCSDICISDGGKKAHCICQEGYSLSPADQRTCYPDPTFRMPQYLYSVGQNLCGTDIIAADQEHVPTDVKCFYNVSGHDMVALGFNAYANFLFFSDSKDNVIHRMLLTNDVINASSVDVISANTGLVSGLAVDWIAENLYWTDRERGVIMVSRLTGRYPKVLLKDLDNPKSIAVNPLNGTMYWATSDTIYLANMDGTNVQVLIHLSGSSFDGMVLDIRRDLLYWVDQSLPGIRSCHMNGSGLAIVIQADVSKEVRTFRDVTVYESYIAWTDGLSTVYFGVTSFDNSSLVNILRGLQHVEEKTSHDIITYDFYLQPPLQPGATNPCDIDNDAHGCSQLCLLTPSGRKCSCSIGFRLVNDLQCVSEPLVDNFLVFVDPYHKSAYQFDLHPSDASSSDRLRGIALQSANVPSLVTFDLRSQNLFWFDEDRLKNSIKRISITETVHYHTVTTLTKDVQVDRIDASSDSGGLLYTDSSTGSVWLVDAATGVLRRLEAPRNVYAAAVTLDDVTGDIYWVDRVNGNIYKCHVTSSCSENSAGSIVLHSWTGSEILGLNIALKSEMNLILWTENTVYSVQDGRAVVLFSADSSVNFTAVVVVGKIIYYATWTGNAVFQFDMETNSTGITVQGFSRITDLKAYCSSETTAASASTAETASAPTAEAAVGGGGLGRGPTAGIVIGCLVFLVLLVLLVICLAMLWRREKKPTTPTVAYTNETYDHLSSVVANLSSLPEGAHGITAYDHYDGLQKDKKGLPFPEASADDPPLYFAGDSKDGATGYDFFAIGAGQYEEKKGLPFPEVCAGDLPIFKIDGGVANAKDHQQPQTNHTDSTVPSPAFDAMAINDESYSTNI